jgi:hypothetical protein
MTASHMALHGMLRLIALSNTGMAALTALMVAAAESAGRCSCASAIATTAGCATPPGHGDHGGGQPRLVRREWWDARRCEKGMGLGLGLGLGLGTAAKLSRRTCTREYGQQSCRGKLAGVANGRVSDLLPENPTSRFAFTSLAAR